MVQELKDISTVFYVSIKDPNFCSMSQDNSVTYDSLFIKDKHLQDMSAFHSKIKIKQVLAGPTIITSQHQLSFKP